jgi:hypothetical protein
MASATPQPASFEETLRLNLASAKETPKNDGSPKKTALAIARSQDDVGLIEGMSLIWIGLSRDSH